MLAYITGFSLGLSLILAIGAQNAFVLRQGIRGRFILPVVLACALSDATLIAAGVAGFGALVEAAPWIEPVMRYAGATFLLVYGAMAARQAWLGTGALKAAEEGAGSARAAVLTVLAFTWLNPHVYLDTVVMLGTLSTRWEGQEWIFGAGAMTASFVFFFALGYGARLLAPLFERPVAWRVLDALVALVMWVIALKLLQG